MKLNEYFENAKGIGVLATSDAAGKVNAAVYGLLPEWTCNRES